MNSGRYRLSLCVTKKNYGYVPMILWAAEQIALFLPGRRQVCMQKVIKSQFSGLIAIKDRFDNVRRQKP
jgi:hypothetical protein